jgi:L-alanine-DL-glutamate epimerase-like enolase superfamily enzyme
MKIAGFRTFVVGNPPPGFGGRYFVFLELVTDGGVEGIGEAYSVPFGPDVVTRMLADVCERRVVGEDPFRIEQLWRRIYSTGYSQRPDATLMAVLSAIEMACWDIVGKETGRPVHELLGGRVHERLRAYSYLYPEEGDETDVYRDPELAAERAQAYVAQGFSAVKFDPVGAYTAFDPRQPSLEVLDHAERFVRTVRRAVESRCDLLIGTHGQMTPAAALRLARRIAPYDPLWLEEPTPPERPEAMAQVARGTDIPVATGERLVGKHEFARVLECGAAAILQMNTGRVGGILEARKIAGMAEAYYAQIAPHLYCGPVVGAANIQLAACSPNFLVLEGIQRWDGFHAEILKRPIRFADGFVEIPTEPGLGVELDEAVAARHPYTGDRLHLEMQDTPAEP